MSECATESRTALMRFSSRVNSFILRPAVTSTQLTPAQRLRHMHDQRVLVYFCRTLMQEIDLSGERSTAVERSPLNSSL
jgi:hypothetical protein